MQEEQMQEQPAKIFRFAGFKMRNFIYRSDDGQELSGVVDYRTEMLPEMTEEQLLNSFEKTV